MTKPNLQGVYLKLKRAQDHFAELNASIQAWSGSKEEEHAPRFDHHPDRQSLDIVVHNVRPTDAEWPLIVGDCIHNLRSALDHLVYQLILVCGHEAEICKGPGITFPICTVEKSFRNTSEKIHGLLSDDMFTMIKQRQPYNALNPISEPLWLLSELDIVDKHRVVLVASKHFRAKDIRVRINDGASLAIPGQDEWRPLEDGATIGTVDLSTLNLEEPFKVDVNAQTEIAIIFGQNGCAFDGLSAQETLSICGNCVKRIVWDFRVRFFNK